MHKAKRLEASNSATACRVLARKEAGVRFGALSRVKNRYMVGILGSVFCRIIGNAAADKWSRIPSFTDYVLRNRMD